jgi:hypothetical protein
MDWAVRGSNCGRNKGFLFFRNVRTGAGAHQPSSRFQRFQRVKRPGHHVTHSSSSGINVKGEWSRSSAVSVYLHGVNGGGFIFFLARSQNSGKGLLASS